MAPPHLSDMDTRLLLYCVWGKQDKRRPASVPRLVAKIADLGTALCLLPGQPAHHVTAGQLWHAPNEGAGPGSGGREGLQSSMTSDGAAIHHPARRRRSVCRPSLDRARQATVAVLASIFESPSPSPPPPCRPSLDCALFWMSRLTSEPAHPSPFQSHTHTQTHTHTLTPNNRITHRHR